MNPATVSAGAPLGRKTKTSVRGAASTTSRTFTRYSAGSFTSKAQARRTKFRSPCSARSYR